MAKKNTIERKTWCDENKRTSKFIVSCHKDAPNTAVNSLLLFFGVLYLLSGVLGVLYTILKDVDFSDLFAGVYTASELVAKITTGRVCDDFPIDVWTIPHFIGHGFLVVLYYRFHKNWYYAIAFSMLVGVLWEAVERAIVEYAYNFACESWGNSVFDLAIGLLGSLLAVYVLTFKGGEGKNGFVSKK